MLRHVFSPSASIPSHLGDKMCSDASREHQVFTVTPLPALMHLTASDHALHPFPHSHLVFTHITPLPALTLGVHPYYTPPRTHTQCSPILHPFPHSHSVFTHITPLPALTLGVHPYYTPPSTHTQCSPILHPFPHSHSVFTHITPLPAPTQC